MSLLFIEGFDHYTSLTYLQQKWDYWTTYSGPLSVTINVAYGRHGQGLRITGNSENDSIYFCKNVSPQQTMIAGCARWFTTFIEKSTTGHVNKIEFRDVAGGASQVTITIEENGSVAARLGQETGAVIAQSAIGVVHTSSWNYMEAKVKADNAAGTVTVKVNGVQVINVAGVDTQVSANALIDQVAFGVQCGETSTGTYIDDIYICDDQGAVNNDLLGDVRIDTLYPDGAGNSADWTPSAGANWQCVDEAPPNEDTDYVEEGTTTDHDTYTCDDTAVVAGTVYGVQQVLTARKDDAGSRGIKGMIRSGGADYAPGITHALSDSYYPFMSIFELDPDTAALWTLAGINAAEFGQRLES